MKSFGCLKTDTHLNYTLIQGKPLCLPSRTSRHSKAQGTMIKLGPVPLEGHTPCTRYLSGGINFRRHTCNYSAHTTQ